LPRVREELISWFSVLRWECVRVRNGDRGLPQKQEEGAHGYSSMHGVD
jgi:hypothetical protein